MSSSIYSTARDLHQKKHVAVLAFPYGSHAAPLLSLVRRISAAAPEVLFSFFNTAGSNISLFSGSPRAEDSNVRAHEVPDGLPAGYVLGGNLEEPVNRFLDVAAESFRRAVGAAEVESGRKISCLVADSFLGFAAEMAEEMQVAWVAYYVGVPRSLLVHLDAANICHRMGSDVQEDTMLDFVPGFSALPAGDILELVTHNPTSNFSNALHKIGSTLPRAAAVTLNTWEELDPSLTAILKSKLKEFLSIGPLALASPPSQADAHGCLEWLNHHQPGSVAYIAFGRVALPPPDELAAIAESLQETVTSFIWSMRPKDESQLPNSFLQEGAHKGMIVPWTPQQKVLEHSAVGAYVTHGGWNSIADSIIGGVPMICRGFFGDQKVNARTVQDVWRIGLVVEGGRFTKARTTEALRRVLSGEEGMTMRENINALKEPAFKAVEPNGSSTHNLKKLVRIVTE